jgi:hypothetical protein
MGISGPIASSYPWCYFSVSLSDTEIPMRYMIMHKTSAHYEAGGKPGPELIQRVGGMVGELIGAGILKGGDGLGPSSQGARVRVAAGKVSVQKGPFSGAGALPSRYALFRAATLDQAADRAARFGGIFGDATVDVRPMVEAWDLGFAPKPEGLTGRRYMAVVAADASSEGGTALRPEQRSALKAFAEDLERAGDFLGMEAFEPSRKGKRLRAAGGNGKAALLDGPFTETKELIGGFVIVETPALEDAVGWAERYLAVVDTEEVDVRGIAEGP